MIAHRPNFTLKDEIRDYWSDRAATFDASASHRIEDRHGMPEWRRMLREALGLGPSGDLADWRALDIACGTGKISRLLTGLGAEVTAIDFSDTMLAIARHKLVGQRWQSELADAEALHRRVMPMVYFGRSERSTAGVRFPPFGPQRCRSEQEYPSPVATRETTPKRSSVVLSRRHALAAPMVAKAEGASRWSPCAERRSRRTPASISGATACECRA